MHARATEHARRLRWRCTRLSALDAPSGEGSPGRRGRRTRPRSHTAVQLDESPFTARFTSMVRGAQVHSRKGNCGPHYTGNGCRDVRRGQRRASHFGARRRINGSNCALAKRASLLRLGPLALEMEVHDPPLFLPRLSVVGRLITGLKNFIGIAKHTTAPGAVLLLRALHPPTTRIIVLVLLHLSFPLASHLLFHVDV
jgi:hypothetical protein